MNSRNRHSKYFGIDRLFRENAVSYPFAWALAMCLSEHKVVATNRVETSPRRFPVRTSRTSRGRLWHWRTNLATIWIISHRGSIRLRNWLRDRKHVNWFSSDCVKAWLNALCRDGSSSAEQVRLCNSTLRPVTAPSSEPERKQRKNDATITAAGEVSRNG
jgi:hypothetical protein